MKHLITFTLLILAIACTPKVLFKNPQPADCIVLDHIPIEYQGLYFTESDSSLFHINNRLVYNETPIEFVVALQDVIDSENCRIADGGVYFPHTTECVPYEHLTEDTIIGTMMIKDTLLNFGKGQEIRQYEDNIVINVQNENGVWISNLISKEGQSILWQLIAVPNKEDKVKAITPNYTIKLKSNSDQEFIINPTRLEFKTILDKGYLKDIERLIPYNFENPIL